MGSRPLWARSKFGLWYAALGVVKMLHTDNKQQIRKLIQSPSKRRSYVTPGGLYHRPNLERAHKGRLPLVSLSSECFLSCIILICSFLCSAHLVFLCKDGNFFFMSSIKSLENLLIL